MTERLVRGSWLIGGVKFFRTHYPPETNERLLSSLPKPLRAQLAEIQPVGWYTRSYHVDVMKLVVSAHREESSAHESLLSYGQLVGADAGSGPLRSLMQIATVRLLAKKLPQLWANDHQDDGRLEVDIAQVDEGRLTLRLSALQGYEHVPVVALGWVKGLLLALGRRDVAVKQTGWSLDHSAPTEITCEVRWS